MNHDTLQSVLIFILTALILGVPVLAFSMRFALKPLVESYMRMKEAQQGGSSELPALKRELALLDQRMQAIEEHVDRLDEVAEFHRQLEKPKT